MSDGWVDRDKTSNVAVSAAVRVQASRHPGLDAVHRLRRPQPVALFRHAADQRPARRGAAVQELQRRRQQHPLSRQLESAQDRVGGHRQHHDPQRAVLSRTASGTGRTSKATPGIPDTGLIDRSSYIEIFHNQQQIGDRMDATFRGHVLGMKNEFVAGFDVNRIDFTHTNNSPFSGTSSVNPGRFRSRPVSQPDRRPFRPSAA